MLAENYFTFDFDSGVITAHGGDRVLVLTENVVKPLLDCALKLGDVTALRELGRRLGNDVKKSDAASLPIEQVALEISNALSMFGWGRFEIERWGEAVVVRLHQVPSLDSDRLCAAALLGGLLSSLMGENVGCVPVKPDNRFIVVHPSITETLWRWSCEGLEVPDLVKRLGS